MCPTSLRPSPAQGLLPVQLPAALRRRCPVRLKGGYGTVAQATGSLHGVQPQHLRPKPGLPRGRRCHSNQRARPLLALSSPQGCEWARPGAGRKRHTPERATRGLSWGPARIENPSYLLREVNRVRGEIKFPVFRQTHTPTSFWITLLILRDFPCV